MAATVDIKLWTGAAGGPTKTTITSANVRRNAADAVYTTETTNPIVVPTSGSNYSFWAATRLSCSVGPAALINNLKFYTDGANGFGTGVTMIGETATTYVQATGTDGVTGTQLTTSAYATLAGTPSDLFAYTSGSPLSVAGSTSTTGDFGDFVVYQFVVTTTASPGATGVETWTWTYDEV